MALRSIALLALILAGLMATPRPAAFAAEAKTSKERLSTKAADDQRVDNCRVPLEQRGSTPRPDCETQSPSTARSTPPETKPSAR